MIRYKGDQSERIVTRIREIVGRDLPLDLNDFYRERISQVGGYKSIVPIWNSYVGWRLPDHVFTQLIEHQAIPIFSDDFGNMFGLDISGLRSTPSVYFFDHEQGERGPIYAAGSSLGAFMLLLADQDRAFEEDWPPRWELSVDPDLENCPRAPPIWLAN